MDEKQTVYNFKKICLNSDITINYLSNPCTYPKAQKNEIELINLSNRGLFNFVPKENFDTLFE